MDRFQQLASNLYPVGDDFAKVSHSKASSDVGKSGQKLHHPHWKIYQTDECKKHGKNNQWCQF